jgi:hypothetical protein
MRFGARVSSGCRLTDEELDDMYAYLMSIKHSPAVKEIPLREFAEGPPQ